MSMKPGYTGLTRIVKATGYSWRGFRAAWRNESAFRQECILGLLMLPLAFLVGQTMFQVAMLIATLAIVIITELLNSALEAAVDRVSPEYHDLAGRAKDMASAAVFVSLFLVITVWSMMIIKNFFMT